MFDATACDPQTTSREAAEDELALDPSDPIEVADAGDPDTGGDPQTGDPNGG